MDKNNETEIKKEDKQRIIDDVKLIESVINDIKVDKTHIDQKEIQRIIDLAKRYTKDTEYFLDKEDDVTGFGSINYAHGLLDALRIIQGKI